MKSLNELRRIYEAFTAKENKARIAVLDMAQADLCNLGCYLIFSSLDDKKIRERLYYGKRASEALERDLTIWMNIVEAAMERALKAAYEQADERLNTLYPVSVEKPVEAPEPVAPKVGTVFSFNSGREYSDEGQPIEVIIHAVDDNDTVGFYWCAVAFHDKARGICGKTEKVIMCDWHGKVDTKDIMNTYDSGHYTSITCSEFDTMKAPETDSKPVLHVVTEKDIEISENHLVKATKALQAARLRNDEKEVTYWSKQVGEMKRAHIDTVAAYNKGVAARQTPVYEVKQETGESIRFYRDSKTGDYLKVEFGKTGRIAVYNYLFEDTFICYTLPKDFVCVSIQEYQSVVYGVILYRADNQKQESKGL